MNMPQTKPEMPPRMQILIGRLMLITAILPALAGIDILFTKLIFKHFSQMTGIFLIFFSLVQLPALFRMRKKTAAINAGPIEGMPPEPPSASLFSRPEPQYQYAPLTPGIVLQAYYYKKLNQGIGLFITAIFFALGIEIVFLHRFIPISPEKGLRIFGWAALVLGGLGFFAGIKSLLIPKPVISITDQGVQLGIAGLSGRPFIIPWEAIHNVRLTFIESSEGGKTDALGLQIDPQLKLPGIYSFASMANSGEFTFPLTGLNASPQEVVEQVGKTWRQYSFHSSA